MDFAHARTFVARTGVWFPSLGPIPPVSVHPDTASSDLFERFEALSLEAKENAFDASTSKRNSNSTTLQVTTQFDQRVHRGTQRDECGPPSFVDESAPAKNGPLTELFLQYSMKDEFGNAADGFDGACLLSKAEVFKMMRDFGVVESGVTGGVANGVTLLLRSVEFAFANADAPAFGDDAVNNKENQLDFTEFCRFLVNVVFLSNVTSTSSDEKDYKDSLPKTTVTLLKQLKCDKKDTRNLRAFMDQCARLGDRNARVDDEENRMRKNEIYPKIPQSIVKRNNGNRDYTANSSASSALATEIIQSMKGVDVSDASHADKRFVSVFRELTKREAIDKDVCQWRLFPKPAVDCGTLFPGETRRFRVRIANGNLHSSCEISIETKGLPCIETRCAERVVLAPGLTTTVDVVAGADAAGEWLGAIVVSGVYYGSSGIESAAMDKDTVHVPVYLNVVHRDRQIVTRAGDVVGMRGFERTNGLSGTNNPEHQSGIGFKPQPGGFATAEHLVHMKDPVFVSKAKSGKRSKRAESCGQLTVESTQDRQVTAAAKTASALEASHRDRDRGWWGEDSEWRLGEEAVAMAKTKLAGENLNSNNDAKVVDTAFRLSRKGLRY